MLYQFFIMTTVLKIYLNLKKLIPTYIGVFVDEKTLKYAPAYKIGEDDNIPKPIIENGSYVYFDTPQEALNYLNK